MKATLKIHNQSPVPLHVFWVSFEGKETAPLEVRSGTSNNIDTHGGHHFRIYGETASDDEQQLILLKEHAVANTAEETVTIVGDCDELTAAFEERQSKIDLQMKELVHDQAAPCLPAHDSSQWSCIHHLSKADYETRLKDHAGTLYGFNSTDESQQRDIGDTADKVWSKQIPQIPRLASGNGYLKMSFTQTMKDILLPWYEQHKAGGPQDVVYEHRVIPGGFTNSHTIPMSILNLDAFPEMKQILVDEMQQVLEWWTGQQLVPTSTFGIRIYHRDSMLINHVDRSDTHLASAVIQVGQHGVDQGWPLEVLHPTDGSCSEVYLQPGEMVLYEGARFRHGRPMRLVGEDFANIFSHFRPVDWNGPGNSPNYDGKLDEHGFVVAATDEASGDREL